MPLSVAQAAHNPPTARTNNTLLPETCNTLHGEEAQGALPPIVQQSADGLMVLWQTLQMPPMTITAIAASGVRVVVFHLITACWAVEAGILSCVLDDDRGL